jgi:arylsulfatase A-like enzyme
MNTKHLLNQLIATFSLWALIGGQAVCAQTAPTSEAALRPNFLILLTDDQRTDTLGCYNARSPIVTPAIDQLAREGVRFENGFVTTPVCAVSRASILTGRYASNHRMHRFDTMLADDVFDQSYPAYMQDAGYFSGHFGKYGVGITSAQKARFDVFDAQMEQGPMFRDYNGRTLHDAEWLTVKAGEFFAAVPEGEPFVLQLSYKEPHNSSCPDPVDAGALSDYDFQRSPDDTKDAYDQLPDIAKPSLMEENYASKMSTDALFNDYMRAYHEKLLSVERSVGKVRHLLEQHGFADNTIILFLSDHGTHFGEKKFAGKWTPYDASLRIPFIVYDPRPSALKEMVRNEMVLNIDLAPTLLDLAGIEVPDIMDGRSMLPLLTPHSSLATDQWRSHFAYEHFTSPSQIPVHIPRYDGIRTDDFKYVRWCDADPAVEELFDLENDPSESNNLASNPEYADQLNQLRIDYSKWRAQNPMSYAYNTYGWRPHSGNPEIDWERFKSAHPEKYARIAEQVQLLDVTWQQAVSDRAIRIKISHAVEWLY